MKSLNSVQLIGYIGDLPEVKELNGKLVAKFSVATTDDRVDKSTAEKQSHTEWHRIVCFSKFAEMVGTYIKKGARVYLSGKLKTSKWQDKNNETRYLTEIIANDLIMLDSKPTEK